MFAYVYVTEASRLYINAHSVIKGRLVDTKRMRLSQSSWLSNFARHLAPNGDVAWHSWTLFATATGIG